MSAAAAAHLAAALDPCRLARLAGITPDPWQARVLRSASPRILLNCGRQTGKSTATGLVALHTALFEPGALVLLLSRGLRQSQELFRTVTRLYRALERPVPAAAATQLTLELANGSRVLALPGSEETNRGLAGVRLLVVDEAARVRDEDYYALRPMLATSGGRLIALSTPFGTRGWWYESWRSAEPWERYTIPTRECPRVPAAFLEEERRVLGPWWYQQEYEAEFLAGETQPFAREDVDRAFAEEVQPWAL